MKIFNGLLPLPALNSFNLFGWLVSTALKAVYSCNQIKQRGLNACVPVCAGDEKTLKEVVINKGKKTSQPKGFYP